MAHATYATYATHATHDPYDPLRSLPLSLSHLQSDRRAEKSERFAEAVLQKPLIGKVEFGRDVRKQRKCRGRHTDLSRVHNPNRFFSGTRHRMRGSDFLQKPIQLRSRDAARALGHHFLDHFQQLWRALA